MSQAEQFMKQWKAQREVLEAVLEQIPEGKEGFAPWDGAMTLGQLAVHTATAAQSFAQVASTGEFAQTSVTWSTMDDVRRVVHELTQQTQATIEAISDTRWSETVDLTKVLGSVVKVSNVLYGLRDHEIHHKGQMFVYARMVGADNLPMFTKFS